MPPRHDQLTAKDIHGAWAIIPTPAKDNASDWRAEDTVDLDETARVVEALIAAGIDGIIALGTLGECATLTWQEKRSFMATIVETARGRVPFFGGTTSLNTRETVRQAREIFDLGVDGTMVGPPMWCEVDVPAAVQFYRDLAEGCPKLPICVYANPEAFKFPFPRPFWAQVAEIPQIVMAKYIGVALLEADLRLTKGRIRLCPQETMYYAAARLDPEQCTGFWSTGAVCGPSVPLRLRDDVIKARASGDWSGAKAVSAAMAVAGARFFPHGSYEEFSKYNIQIEKARASAAGWMKPGPNRPPYQFLSENYREGAADAGRNLAKLHAEYSEIR